MILIQGSITTTSQKLKNDYLLVTLKEEEEVMKSIFIARVRLHEASNFNKVTRHFIDANSICIHLIATLWTVHFTAIVNEDAEYAFEQGFLGLQLKLLCSEG